MKDEYIKKMDITQRVLAITGEWKDGPEFWIPIDPVLGNIALLPAEDVAPVRHGRWVDKGTVTDEKAEVITEWQSARCTCCNKYHTTPYLYYFDNFTYCPNCGAKMDRGEE